MDKKLRISLIAVLIGSALLSLFRFVYPETDWSEVVSIVTIVSIVIALVIEKIVFTRYKD